ncbi:MAG: DUF3108 domain-containing protein [Bacteriovoracaceae bacterium]|nr:DUF3108 domain-containing protein [Bacteriovoracaceae bacterium]
MNYKIFFFVSLLVILLSCSVSQYYDVDLSKEELVESFDLNKEEFKQFETKQITPVAKTAQQEQTVVTTDKKSKQAQVKKKTAKTIKKNSSKKVGTASELSQTKKLIAPIPQYPPDYPDKYIELDKKTKKFWKLFKPQVVPGEEYVYKIKYFGVTAGYITFRTKDNLMVSGREVYHLNATLKSAKYYKYVYSLNDSLNSYIDKETLVPIKYALSQRESGKSIDDLQLFDHKALKTYFWYKKIKKEKVTEKKKSAFLPKYFQDSFSIMFFIRGAPLNIGDIYEIPIVNQTKVKIFRVKVVGYEELEIKDKKVQAVKLMTSTLFPGELKKGTHITIWLKKDGAKQLLRFSAKIKIGAIWGNLVK